MHYRNQNTSQLKVHRQRIGGYQMLFSLKKQLVFKPFSFLQYAYKHPTCMFVHVIVEQSSYMVLFWLIKDVTRFPTLLTETTTLKLRNELKQTPSFYQENRLDNYDSSVVPSHSILKLTGRSREYRPMINE